jgi:UDP-N-acetylmuramoyl-tripeptide--D-alanyl-D-alanine ligase
VIAFRLSVAAQLLGGTLAGADADFTGASTDTRTLAPGALFIALAGPRHDGHDHLDEAAARGAAGAMVARRMDCALPQIEVGDTHAALGQLAAAWRARFTLPVIGITGSNGKTTVKELLAAILAERGATLATQGNLNNDIGVPLTLFGLGAGHRFAVIEMGANHPGEIAYVARLARPSVALVNNAGPAHLEGFGSLEGVAQAKGEIYDALADDGIAVINHDDRFAPDWRARAGTRRVLGFGLAAGAGVSARDLVLDSNASRYTLLTPAGECPITLPLAGRHNVMNALAASAAALAAGATLADIAAGIAAVKPMQGRLVPRSLAPGVYVLDDSYNANLASLEAGLAVLARSPGTHWLAFGDMGELGEQGPLLHARAGELARAAGVARLYACGPLAQHAVIAFGTGAEHFPDAAALGQALAAGMRAPVTLLVKGSRFMRMEQVIAALDAHAASPAQPVPSGQESQHAA